MTTQTATELERTYVVFPEEPDSYINLPRHGGTALMRFQNGRLLSTRDKLTDDDIQYFQRQNDLARREKFIIFTGVPSGLQLMEMQNRIMRMCAGKAGASNPQKIAEDTEFTMLRIFAGDDGMPDVKIMPTELLAVVEKLLPGQAQDALLQRLAEEQIKHTSDDEAISRGMNGMPTEVAQETAEDVDKIPLPANFDPPPKPSDQF